VQKHHEKISSTASSRACFPTSRDVFRQSSLVMQAVREFVTPCAVFFTQSGNLILQGCHFPTQDSSSHGRVTCSFRLVPLPQKRSASSVSTHKNETNGLNAMSLCSFPLHVESHSEPVICNSQGLSAQNLTLRADLFDLTGVGTEGKAITHWNAAKMGSSEVPPTCIPNKLNPRRCREEQPSAAAGWEGWTFSGS